jgi:hypothetical protein
MAARARRVSSQRRDRWNGYFELEQTLRSATRRLLAATAARR